MIEQNERLKEVIEAYLDQTGSSRRKLSLAIGTNANFVKDLLSGRVAKPRQLTLMAIAKHMGISVIDLLNPERPIPKFSPPAQIEDSEFEMPADIVYIPYMEIKDGKFVSSARYAMLPVAKRLLAGKPLSQVGFTYAIETADDGSVSKKDLLIIDTSETETVRPGIYLLPASGRAYTVAALTGGSRPALAQMIWRMQQA